MTGFVRTLDKRWIAHRLEGNGCRPRMAVCTHFGRTPVRSRSLTVGQLMVRFLSLLSSENAGISISKCSPLAETMP